MRRGREQERTAVKVEKRTKYTKTFDYLMILSLVFLLCIGLIMVFSSSYYVAQINGKPRTHFFLKQLICVGIGAVLMIFLMFFDYHRFNSLGNNSNPHSFFGKIKPYWVILIASIISLALVYLPGIGVNINGSRRWINLGVSIQPSEILKMGLIIFMACSINKNPRKMDYFTYGVLPYTVILAIAAGIIYFQPNFSAIICVAGLYIALLVVGGARGSHILAIVGAGALVLFILVAKEGYRSDRISALSDPYSNWQLRQSLYSIGSGGLFGKGLGNSIQKLLYLPYRESDFIFAIIAEELGLLGCLFVITLFMLLIWRCVVAAMRAPDLTGMLIASGTAAMIAIQVVVNIGVNVGLLPPTGVVLPFISYGGSGILIFMSMVGITLNISRQGSTGVPVDRRGELVLDMDKMQVPKDEKRARREKRKKEAGKAIGADRWDPKRTRPGPRR